MDINKFKKSQFFIFIGMIFFVYLLAFFPHGTDIYEIKDLAIDTVKSISISFVLVYVTYYMGVYKMPKSVK